VDLAHGEPCTVVCLPFEPTTARRARRMMATELASIVPRGVIDDAQLVLSELVTNGLKHGLPDAQNEIEVGWCVLDGYVRICVCDAGQTSVVDPSPVDLSAERGRGLAIVNSLCDTWSLDTHAGTTVTADITIP
jgi:anti-sigma regulatory factor (Ser/Thr protein kinase)